MDPIERIAFQYLRQRGIDDHEVEFEPDGNVPPDFLVRGRVAVEVRRLNQNEQTADGPRGVQTTPTWQSVSQFVKTIGPPASDESWWVLLRILRRPAKLKSLKKAIGAKLAAFRQWPHRHEKHTHRFAVDGLRLELSRANGPHPSFFVPAGVLDRRVGGFILSELIRNIPICVEEKRKKVSPYRDNYPEWWLVLVDHVHGHLEPYEEQELRSHVRVPADWDRVVLVSASDPRRSLEFCPAP